MIHSLPIGLPAEHGDQLPSFRIIRWKSVALRCGVLQNLLFLTHPMLDCHQMFSHDRSSITLRHSDGRIQKPPTEGVAFKRCIFYIVEATAFHSDPFSHHCCWHPVLPALTVKTIRMVSKAFKMPVPFITPNQCYRQCPSEEAMCGCRPLANKTFHLPIAIFEA